MKPKILALVGSKRAGKTRFLETYIPKLRAKEVTVGTIKCASKSVAFDFKKYSFDVERHSKAGSQSIVFRSSINTSIILNRSTSLQFALKQLAELDYIFIEGQLPEVSGFPQLLFVKTAAEIPDLLTEYTVAISCLTTDKPIDHPLFQPFDEMLEIVIKNALPQLPQLNCNHCGMGTCEEMLKAIIKGDKLLSDCEPLQDHTWEFSLTVNGEDVPCVEFIQDILRESFLSAVGTLKGINKPIDSLTFNTRKK